MIKNNYNEKFRKFFEKFKKQNDLLKTQEEKDFLWDLAVDFVEKNRDFVMQYPIVQYWEKIEDEKQNFYEKEFFKEYENKEINLYFHIPFCKTRCSYCNFHIVVWDKNKELMSQIYITKLKKEIDLFIENLENFKIKTIFIWWWTPSYLDNNFLEEILSYIDNKFKKFFKEDIEYSFEWNPDSFNKENLLILKKYWINRLSFWVQTFDNEIIKKINRTYTEKTVYDIINLSKKIWFKNINIDMIYGLPWHNYEIMKRDLKIASTLDIQHLTYYPLYYYDEAILSKTKKREDNIKQIYNFYDEVVSENNLNWFKQYWREYFSKNWKISHYQNNFVSNDYLYWFWVSWYSFNKKYAFRKEDILNKYLINKYNLKDFFSYNSIEKDRRLFVLWTRNIKIEKSKIKNIDSIRKIIKLWVELKLINEYEDYFLLTKKWLKYQEVLAHIFI